MGVIKRILLRNNSLGTPQHRNMFLDMEENIHVHFRDLRLELSRAEFEEFSSVFTKQSQELLSIIYEKNYQDGVLSNTNQEDIRIWTESRLKNDVRYNPKRLSIEDCGDGFHFHYRNYKILIDPASFRMMVEAFKEIDLDASYASTPSEVIELLKANEIDFMPGPDIELGRVISITVAKHHLPKVRDILGYIGFAREKKGDTQCYVGKNLTVVVHTNAQLSSLDYMKIRGISKTERLEEYLSRSRSSIDADELNQIKCQVLDLYYSLASDKTLHVEIDNKFWLYAPASGQVIFPYKVAPHRGKRDAEILYKSWSSLLARLELNFLKTTKYSFPEPEQNVIRKKVDDFLRREVASFVSVDRIYILGSAMRGDMGIYRTPFVHGKLAKLGSDIDIFVEINPELEADVPEQWQLISPTSSRHCAVYHLGQIPLNSDPGQWQILYPHIPFTHHLADAYVSFPSQGHQKEKNAFLKQFGAKCFYDRTKDGIIHRSDLEESIAAAISEHYSIQNVAVEKMKVSTENTLFKIFSVGQCHILKLFKVSGNYNRSRVAEHVLYEAELVNQLKARGIPTAGTLQSSRGSLKIEGSPALLFERIPGKTQQRPEYPLETIGAALAKMHHVQLDSPLDLPSNFTFDEVCLIWLPQYSVYPKNTSLDQGVVKALQGLMPLVDRYNPGEHRKPMYDVSPFVHGHGDVTPKNVIVSTQGIAFFFDFNNAFYGPRMSDIIDGAFEFSLAEKYIHLADFSRFDAFISSYANHFPLSPEERQDLPRWIELIGLIKFAKEIKVMLERPQEELRRRRALTIAEFVLSRTTIPSG